MIERSITNKTCNCVSRTSPVVLCLGGFLCLVGTAVGQDNEQTTTATAESQTEAVEKEYRNLIGSLAADFSNPKHEVAFKIAVQEKYRDSRYDDAVRNVFQTSSVADNWDIEKLSRALKLLRLSTIPDQQAVEMALECYLQNVQFKQRGPNGLRLELYNYLSEFPNQVSSLVLQRLQRGEYPAELYDLTKIVGDSSEKILPLMLKTAKSGDTEHAERAMVGMPDLIESLKRRELERKRQQELAAKQPNGKVPVGNQDRYIKYAERIISRYDKNGDDELVQTEWKAMLVSPAEADMDRNGRIGIAEYANWMQSRSRK